MPAQSTEMWSEQRSVPTAQPGGGITWSIRRAWHVSGASTDDEARNAVPLDGRPVCRINDAHSDYPDALCRSLPVEPMKGPFTKKVTAVYEVPADGEWSDETNPLLQKMLIEPDWSLSDEELELDFGDPRIPVLNSAGFPFENGPRTTIADIGFRLTRNEPTFSYGTAIDLQCSCNADAFSIPGVGTIGPGQGFLHRFIPGPYKLGATYVPVIRIILCRADGWRSRTKDQGRQGHATAYIDGEEKPIIGPFCNEQGVILSEPVLLDGTGLPLSDRVFVRDDNGKAQQPIANDDTSTTIPAEYIDRASTSPTAPAFLKFKKFRPKTWTGILL